ncbi:hypothetical protein LZ198_40235 [Myxococcus sp. K15C18031901]|uniref:hypothetical protein n=1 Tax=Myxococcus dinghuensis TaxID=2906761 RepID=UPI0020A80D2F|nr:hypothetical protein [Myxococcus dinghuensis]MCP3105115.1 hypothetical protein [Myxococcus dinghuensis]
MKSLRRRILLVGLGGALSACAARPAPPVMHYSLGMSRADYRDYTRGKASPCDAEPRWLSDELSAVNGLLSRFLDGTEKAADLDAPEQGQQLTLLEEASRTLPPLLDVHEGNLRGLARCKFRDTGAFPELSRRGTELVGSARERLAGTQAAVAASALKATQDAWKEGARERESTARGTWCTANPKVGEASVFYARQNLEGVTEWRFCDGSRVEQRPDAEPSFVEPEGVSARDRRRIQPPRYLQAAKEFPAEEIDRAPTTAAAKSDATPP